MEDQELILTKGKALLEFLKGSITLRRQHIPTYRTNDKILWFSEIPKNRTECRIPFYSNNFTDTPDDWLEVRKIKMPVRPPVPKILVDWIRPEDLDYPNAEPELLPEITVVVEREVPDLDTPSEHQRMVKKKSFPKLDICKIILKSSMLGLNI